MSLHKLNVLIVFIIFTSCTEPVIKDNTLSRKQQKSTITEAQTSNNVGANGVQVYTTASNSDQRLAKTNTLQFENVGQALESEISIFVNPNKTFQSFLGIGGAITDASSEIFATLTPEKQAEFLKAYYDKEEGIGYSLARTTIHSSDFASASYTYVSKEDKELSTFTIDHDKKYRLPLLKQVIKAAGGKIPLYVSPWSPPAFMKTNKSMLKGGKLLPEYAASWALYYAKFIKAYEQENIPIWGLTIQNEPMATQRWESCIYTAQEERDFLKNHLGPTLEEQGLGDKNIVVWDHNRDLITDRANIIFDDPEASKYAWGIGFHWYEVWAGGEYMYDNLARINESYPDKKMLFTEGCVESFDEQKYQFWPNAERYGQSMINDFNNGTVGWTDWNILLDQTGGPNHVENFCFAPIHADTRTGELIYTPSYYYIGHFSKFIRPDAKRVSTSSSRSHLLSTSFLNTNGTMVTVVMNQSDKEIEYQLYVDRKAVKETIAPHAIQTLVY